MKTPNPSKAPWYFLGLQEMLVYYDPWMAGVVLPSLIVVGLDGDSVHRLQQAGERLLHDRGAEVRYIMFQLGFLELWVTLIVLGTLLRGPNWNFFGPYEAWDAHKVRGAEQRQPVGIFLAVLARSRDAGDADIRVAAGGAKTVRSVFMHSVRRELPGIVARVRILSSRCRRFWRLRCFAIFTSGWDSSVTWCS